MSGKPRWRSPPFASLRPAQGCAAPRTDSGSAFGTPTFSTTALSTKLRGTDPELVVVGKGFSVTASRLSGTGQADLGAGIVLAVPPTAAEPKVTPQQAFDALVAGGNANQSRFALSPPKVELTLFTDLQTGHIRADGTVKLSWTGVLAWAFLHGLFSSEERAGTTGQPQPPGNGENDRNECTGGRGRQHGHIFDGRSRNQSYTAKVTGTGVTR